MNKKYDVIVIGSGIGGLTTAALLSSNKKVLVLEKSSKFGGYCTTFRKNNFIFESSIHAINNCKKGHFAYNILKKCGVINNFRFLKPKALYRTIFPNHDIVVPQENEERYIKTLINFFPQESAGIKKLFKAMNTIYREVEKINRTKKLLKSPSILKSTKLSLKNMIDMYLASDELKAIVSQYWLYCGLPPSRLSPVHFSYICQDYMLNGGYCVEGGVQNIINSLISSIKNNHGEIYPGNDVVEILIENKIAVGVRTKNGKTYYGDYIVSNMDARRTFESINEKDYKVEACLKQMDNTAPSISSCKVYLGLNINVKKIGVDDYEVFMNETYDLDKGYEAIIENKYEIAPFGFCIHSNIDHTLCDKNRTILSMTILSGYDYWKNLDKATYKERKKELADVLIKRVSRLIPDLSNHIEELSIATPLTMERYTGNSKGAAYGWSRNVFFYGSKHMNIQTPIRNIFLASNWTKIGGGVEGVMRSADKAYDLICAMAKHRESFFSWKN